ncbi:hypothetical protein [Lactobacillus helveticus]|uniref:hypothetical protein n=1 Tax=Lactobacillus helveticus TaxID=1587 RepID=UPI0011093BC0|nr:hypothetical protein [Lactobacillus helveticus]TLQ21741.1 hypothetical protein FEZ38_06450 [Lactobacillus helveticus]
MKFYLSSDSDWEPYIDLKRNKLMQKYVQKIKEAGVKVTFEKDTTFENYKHIVVDMLNRKEIVQIRKAIGIDYVYIHEQQFVDEDHKYPEIFIWDR